jgi:tyrosyl-tRNA synthetase
MLERADFASRFSGGNPISLMEFLYPLLQGYDSVAVEADVELGGADQLWNLMMGRVIQERYGLRPQVALTMPLLVGTDGRQKMSQSLGNYIGVEEPPADMFGRVLSIPDTLMLSWFRLAADYEPRRVEELGVAIQDGSLPAVEAKRLLAREIVTLYWGREAAAEAQEAFDRVFRQRLAPEVVPEYSLPAGDPIFLPALLKSAGLTVSSSDARRLIAQGAVRLDGSAVTGEQVPRSELLNRVIQVGKRRFLRVVGV